MKITLQSTQTKISMLIFAVTLIFMAFPLTVSAGEFPVSSFASLKSAVEAASDLDSIVIQDSFAFPETLIIDKSLTFRSPSRVALTVSGNFRHMYVVANNGGDITLEFDNVALIGRKTSPDDTTSGGGITIIRTENHPDTANRTNTIGTLHLVNAVIQRCHNGGMAGSSYGGGISFTWPQGQPVIDYCNLEISGSGTDISYNSANRGGGVAANHITVNNGAVYGNTAAVWAGGIYAYGGLTMNGGSVTGNTAGSYGGGSANYHGDYIINAGTISDNRSGEAGGGIYAGYGLTMNSGNIEDNTTAGYGGGIVSNYAEINGGTIIGNLAAGNGGGVVSFMQTNMSAGDIIGNLAGGNGGGLFNYYFDGYSKDAVITGGLIGGNAATLGGGVFASGGISIVGAVLEGNNSSQNGGGLYAYNRNVGITNSTIIGNTAGLDGGGIWIADLNRLTTNNVAFNSNRAQAGYVWDINNPSDQQQAAYAAIHKSNILATTYTTPYTDAYNNYDVNYASDTIWVEYPSYESGNPEARPGSENNLTGRVYGTPNSRTSIIDSEPALKIAEEEIPPSVTNPKKNPAPESRPNPTTGHSGGFIFLVSVLLCMGAAANRR